VVTAREAQDADLEAVLAELEQLSEEDARAIVAQREAPPTPVRPPARSAVAPTERPELGELSAAFTALRLIRRGRGEVALFLVHEIDGQVIGYRHLLDQLSGAPTVYGLESPGLDRAAPMLPTIDRMAARYVEEILSVDPTGPRIVVGSCFGGVVAYEVARQLHAAGSPGTVVAMLDSVPYGLTSGSKDDVGGTKRDRAGRKSALQSLAATRRMLYRRVWWSRARRYLEAGRVLPPDLHLPIIMHQVAIRFYTTRPYAGRVLNFIPAAIPGDQRQRRELWRDLVDDFELVPIDGALVTHRSFLRGPWIAQVAARLRTEMDRLVTRR
jgi:thioesterase domain-containing protein